MDISFTNSSVSSTRIIYTPSTFARSSLLHLQETGTLQATYPHKNERSGLASCLFFTVLDGSGRLSYGGKSYELGVGDCVFIDCKGKYSHETPRHYIPTNIQNKTQSSQQSELNQKKGVEDRKEEKKEIRECGKVESAERGEGLWSLRWCHFYGPNMNAIYRKYQERGGQPVFRSTQLQSYYKILTELYEIAGSDDYVRDMRIHEKLSSLLILLMEDAWREREENWRDRGESGRSGRDGRDGRKGREEDNKKLENRTIDIQSIKEYLDQNFKQKITLNDLAGKYYINKHYLLALFKERYGVTITAYLNQMRVTYVKQELRFSRKTVEELAAELHIEPEYLSRLFKKIEGVSPSEYRKSWKSGG